MKKNIPRTLSDVYERLFAHFGPQNWWPGDTPFEIAVGAILTQNTNWGNVERAINNLKKNKMLTPKKLGTLTQSKLAELIRPAGYYNIKAKRLKNFLQFLAESSGGSLKDLARRETTALRTALLSVNGVGPETADSILLYALEKEVFVVDAYTRRFLTRHKILSGKEDYETVRNMFEDSFPVTKTPNKYGRRLQFFNEFHALIVMLGKNYCKPKPKCQDCPLNNL